MLTTKQLTKLITIANTPRYITQSSSQSSLATTIDIYKRISSNRKFISSRFIIRSSDKKLLQQLRGIGIGFTERDSTTITLVIKNNEDKVSSIQEALETMLNVKSTVWRTIRHYKNYDD